MAWYPWRSLLILAIWLSRRAFAGAGGFSLGVQQVKPDTEADRDHRKYDHGDAQALEDGAEIGKGASGEIDA